MIFENARAKINLTLDVLGKREDNYHEVEMIMQTVDLCDYLTFEERQDGQIVVRCQAPFIPNDERNLAWQAADALRIACSVQKGVTIEIDKRIPVAAGLAGGSADAAAVLRGLNRLWQLGLTDDELAVIGAKVGSDVPFCIYGGTAIVRGRGEVVEPIDVKPCFWVILVKPAIAVSTADVYRALRLDQIVVRPQTQSMIEAIESADIGKMQEAMGNVLEAVTLSMHPEIDKIIAHLVRLGGQMVRMSGSGPTVFAIVTREQRAKRIYHEIKSDYKEVYLCRTC
nr:4-(cytidine 5'-diphospho)-2-C-methyl-D-erythritol kinase [Bacilli bacterium]